MARTRKTKATVETSASTESKVEKVTKKKSTKTVEEKKQIVLSGETEEVKEESKIDMKEGIKEMEDAVNSKHHGHHGRHFNVEEKKKNVSFLPSMKKNIRIGGKKIKPQRIIGHIWNGQSYE